MRALSGILTLVGMIAAVSLITPLLGMKLKMMPDEWIYSSGHFIIAGSLTALGIIFAIILFSMKTPEAK